MSDLVITLIGVITLSCGDPTTAKPDPCVDNVIVNALMPDGRFHATECKKDNTTDPNIESHEAFIRIRGAKATDSPKWPGAIQCSDHNKGTPCILYPLRKRSLTIDGVSSGGGAKFTNLGDFEKLRWRTLFHGSKLPKISGKNRLASLLIAKGEIKYDTAENMGGAIAATLTVTGVHGPTVIRASSFGELKLTVPEGATIDILNLPRFHALSDFKKTHVHDDCDHFFLHYLLTDDEPEKDCPFPKDGNCPKTGPVTTDAGATIACSNSNYP